jgi:hypothetical protein
MKGTQKVTVVLMVIFIIIIARNPVKFVLKG